MTASNYIVVIDEGTTSTRAIAFDAAFEPAAVAQAEVPLSYPNDGWVEQDGEEIWHKTLQVCRQVIAEIGGAENVAAIGITNQRETTLIWDRETATPIAPAIIWQDRRTADTCEALKAQGLEPKVQEETGLLIDPYFSGTKAAWLLDNVDGARARADAGELAFGTVDTYLIWRLTRGRVHATDMTNASRTLLYPLSIDADAGWSREMLDMLNVPGSLLPEVKPSSAGFGETDPALFGRAIPILSAIGDQQAALVGQGCLSPQTAKITYGTGAFLVANTGTDIPKSENRLLGTLGYGIEGGGSAYALEGAIFNAGTVVQWLRDELHLISDAAQSEAMAAELPDNAGVYLVPAFTGLGAPHWDANARGTITGLTRAASAAHLVRAGLESAAYQTHDLLTAFAADGADVALLRVDGGMAANDWLMQFIADICDRPVERPDFMEMTALGAAALAGIQLGWVSESEWAARSAPGQRFEPNMAPDERARLIAGWQRAMKQTLSD
ncbi:MAG: glycerol kinase GlpK [Hyphomonadaceae bacterium]|nr:glycerol kinase GlpK [Hyphomonadaceae bacterium]